MVYVKTYEQSALPFQKKEALRYFGYGMEKNPPSEEVEKLFDECVKKAMEVCAYRIAYAEFPCRIEGNSVDLGFVKTESRALALNLQGCEKVVAFAATVGVGIDRLIARYESISAGRAYAFQSIGSERVESLCDAFNREIVERYREEGLYTRPRFSCGYGDFPLSCQTAFFAALDCNRKIGLTLNDSLLMSPSKSVTAVIGVSPTPCRRDKNKCAACYKTDCAYRESR